MIPSRLHILLIPLLAVSVNAGLEWPDDFGASSGSKVKVQSSSGYNWDSLIPDSETPRLPSPLPGHPKRKGGEVGCIQIPNLVGTHGPCGTTTDRKAGHLALSMDGQLLAVSERHGSEIFVYDTASLRLRNRSNSRHGMGNIGGMVFGVNNKLVVSSHSTRSSGGFGKSFIRVLDLDKQSSHDVETVKNRTFEAYKDILTSSGHIPHVSAEHLEDLVSTLVWETVLQGEVDLGWAFEGFFNKRPNWDQGPGNGPLSTNGKYLISLFYPGPKTTIVDIDVENSVPQPLFSLPLDAQRYGKDVAAHFTNASSPGQSFIATMSVKDKEPRQLRIYDAATGQIEHVFPLPDDFSWERMSWSRHGIAFSPNGKLASIHNGGWDNSEFHVWHVENGTVLYSFPSDKSVFDNSISFTADGEFVYTWSSGMFYDDPCIRVYRTSTGGLVQDWSLRDAVDRATDYTLDPKSVARNSRIASTQRGINGMIICTLQDGSIALYDVRTNREGFILSSKVEDENRPKPKQSNTTTTANVEVFITEDVEVVVSPDGKTIYSADVDGSIRVWTLD